MFQTIVIGTNWSDTAELTFAKAVELARSQGASLHVVSATGRAPAPASGRGAGASGLSGVGPDFQADVALEQTLDRLGARDVEVEQHSSSLEPGEAIIAVAEQVGADLIVVGNRGMRRRVLGSIPNTVSHRARCDVLIVQTETVRARPAEPGAYGETG